MSRRKLTVKGRGPDGRTTFSMEAYQGKVWIISYDCPFICEAILDPAQADSLIHLVNQTTKEAREYRLSRGGHVDDQAGCPALGTLHDSLATWQQGSLYLRGSEF